MPRPITDPVVRFWSHVDKSGDCWLWTGTRRTQGYGVIRFHGRQERAHRVSYELANGSIPEGLWILHHCDNPPCVRPEHLYAGTVKENVRDLYERGNPSPPPRRPRVWQRKPYQRKGYATGGRHPSRLHPETVRRGEQHPRAHLSDEQVISIRQRVAAGERQVDLAKEFGLQKQTLNFIVTGRAYKHLPGAIRVYKPKHTNTSSSLLWTAARTRCSEKGTCPESVGPR